MTQSFWDHIQKQLDEIIFNELSDSNPAHVLLDTLQDNFWWDKAPFKHMKVWDERNDMTFIQWSNAVSSLMGDDMSDIFDELLKERIRCTIEHQWEIRLRELAEEEEHEMEVAA